MFAALAVHFRELRLIGEESPIVPCGFAYDEWPRNQGARPAA
jgi:hypothetical protein